MRKPARKVVSLVRKLAVRRRDTGLRLAVLLHGIEAANAALLTRTTDVQQLLTRYGAQVGASVIHGPLTIHNAVDDYSNLKIGRDVHIGRGVLLDLTGELSVGPLAVISMGCTILTHQDIGKRPLSALYPRKVAPTIIGAGAYLGANVTVLVGCSVGEGSVVGAGSVVTEPIPAWVVAVGSPARVVRTLKRREGLPA